MALVHISQSLRAFAQLNTMSLCAPPRLYRRAHRALRIWAKKCLCSLLGHLQETVHVPVMGLKDGRGDGHRVIHQPSVAWLPFRHRHPQRYKDPAALSGRPTQKAGHQRSIWPLKRKVVLCTSLCTPSGHKWTQCVFKREKSG